MTYNSFIVHYQSMHLLCFLLLLILLYLSLFLFRFQIPLEGLMPHSKVAFEVHEGECFILLAVLHADHFHLQRQEEQHLLFFSITSQFPDLDYLIQPRSSQNLFIQQY